MFQTFISAIEFAFTGFPAATPASAVDADLSVFPVALALIALLVIVLIALATIVIVLMRISHRRRIARETSTATADRQTPDPWALAGQRLDPDASDDPPQH